MIANKVIESCLEFDIPLKVISEANCREHFRVKAKRVKAQRGIVAAHCCTELWGRPKPSRVVFTRVESRDLDSDNLAGAFKAVRDEVAKCLNFDDRDKAVTWEYEQRRPEKGEARGIRIVIWWA